MFKFLPPIVITLAISFSLTTQSGRRKAPIAAPTATPEAQPTPSPKNDDPKPLQVTAEKNQDYGCTDDGTLARLLDDPESVKGYQPKEVDVRAEILSKPEPRYTDEARRIGVQGIVILKLLLTAEGKIDRIRVMRRLPYGLTENSIRAACAVKFNPAIKDGQKVTQWVSLEYGFSIAKSSIFGP